MRKYLSIVLTVLVTALAFNALMPSTAWAQYQSWTCDRCYQLKKTKLKGKCMKQCGPAAAPPPTATTPPPQPTAPPTATGTSTGRPPVVVDPWVPCPKLGKKVRQSQYSDKLCKKDPPPKGGDECKGDKVSDGEGGCTCPTDTAEYPKGSDNCSKPCTKCQKRGEDGACESKCTSDQTCSEDTGTCEPLCKEKECEKCLPGSGYPWWWLLIVGAGCLILGSFITWLICRRSKDEDENEDEEEPESEPKPEPTAKKAKGTKGKKVTTKKAKAAKPTSDAEDDSEEGFPFGKPDA